MDIKDIKPEIGSRVITDGRSFFAPLKDCDDWNGAEFRIESGPLAVMLAVGVKVTGRKVRWDHACKEPVVRVKVEFPDEDEPSTFASGWMIV